MRLGSVYVTIFFFSLTLHMAENQCKLLCETRPFFPALQRLQRLLLFHIAMTFRALSLSRIAVRAQHGLVSGTESSSPQHKQVLAKDLLLRG